MTATRLDLSVVRADPLYQMLWDAVIARCAELEKAVPCRSTGRSAALIGADGHTVSALLALYQADGTSLRYQVEARIVPLFLRGGGNVSVTSEGPWVNSDDAEWERRIAARDAHNVIIGATWYGIRPDLPERDSSHAGFAGALHRIRYLADGRVIETRNLWHGGTIPPKFRDRLPDDAEFAGRKADPHA